MSNVLGSFLVKSNLCMLFYLKVIEVELVELVVPPMDMELNPMVTPILCVSYPMNQPQLPDVIEACYIFSLGYGAGTGGAPTGYGAKPNGNSQISTILLSNVPPFN